MAAKGIMIWLRWQSIVDFVFLAVVLYGLLLWAKKTGALRLAFVIIGLHAGGMLALHFGLSITGWVLEGAGIAVVGLLLVAFQSDVRQSVMQLDSMIRRGLHAASGISRRCRDISEAAFAMAREHIGALIVITRNNRITEMVNGGVRLDGEVSSEMLRTIFGKGSPVRTGAAVIEADRISRVGVVLPLTEREDVPPQFGTRHRAAIGLAERCDALVIVVSEESENVALVHDRETVPVKDSAELCRVLERLQLPRKTHPAARVRRLVFANLKFKLVALGLAGFIWGTTFLATGTTVKTIAATIEFGNVPEGLEISQQSATSVEVQLRGTPWVMDSLGSAGLTAHFDLSKEGEGLRTLRVGPENLNPPPGVTVERVSPQKITVRLLRRAPL
jgi:DNA integrity scanning protein DisA with diadenylate cyclase activity